MIVGRDDQPRNPLVFLRSLPVQTILKWSQDGSQHPRFNEDELLSIPLPRALEKVGTKTDGLVNESLAARVDAEKLLADAKVEVERLLSRGEA